GCGVPEAIKDASDKIDSMIVALDRTTGTIRVESPEWRAESARWRTAFKELQENFTKNEQELLGKTLRNTADHAISHTSGEVRANIDYLEIKLKDNVKTVRKALGEAQEKVKEAKEKRNTKVLSDILKTLETKVWHDPAVISFVPNHV